MKAITIFGLRITLTDRDAAQLERKHAAARKAIRDAERRDELDRENGVFSYGNVTPEIERAEAARREYNNALRFLHATHANQIDCTRYDLL